MIRGPRRLFLLASAAMILTAAFLAVTFLEVDPTLPEGFPAEVP